ncbi:MAG: hypothetical protein AAFQ29_05775 [Pseudomonadota bacterium]
MTVIDPSATATGLLLIRRHSVTPLQADMAGRAAMKVWHQTAQRFDIIHDIGWRKRATFTTDLDHWR